MSESRALLSLSALLASALLMSGTLLLLQATVKWGAPNIEVEDPVALRTGSGSLSTRVASGGAGERGDTGLAGPAAGPQAVSAGRISVATCPGGP